MICISPWLALSSASCQLCEKTEQRRQNKDRTEKTQQNGESNTRLIEISCDVVAGSRMEIIEKLSSDELVCHADGICHNFTLSWSTATDPVFTLALNRALGHW